VSDRLIKASSSRWNKRRRISNRGFPSRRNGGCERGSAFADLFIEHDNPAAAERFGLALLGKLKLLRANPMLGRVVLERAEPSLREMMHHPYRIVYRVLEHEQRIEVLRFWHGARGKIELVL